MVKFSGKHRVIKRIGISLVILLAVLCVIPYLVPLSRAGDVTLLRPFENSFYYSAGGVDIHYRIFQPESGELRGKIALIHGFASSTYAFEKVAPTLAEEGYLVVAADLPGFGYSIRSEGTDHSQTHRAGLIWALLDETDRTLPGEAARQAWHLAGHSMGGGTVSAMALQRPKDTRSVVLVSAALFETGGGGIAARIPPVRRWLQVLVEYVLVSEDNIRGLLLRFCGAEPGEDEVRVYTETLSLPGTARSLPALLKTTEQIPSEQLSLIEPPVLGIWGGEDDVVPLSDGLRLRTYLPHMELEVIDGAAHCPMSTHAERFLEILREFFSVA